MSRNDCITSRFYPHKEYVCAPLNLPSSHPQLGDDKNWSRRKREGTREGNHIWKMMEPSQQSLKAFFWILISYERYINFYFAYTFVFGVSLLQQLAHTLKNMQHLASLGLKVAQDWTCDLVRASKILSKVWWGLLGESSIVFKREHPGTIFSFSLPQDTMGPGTMAVLLPTA